MAMAILVVAGVGNARADGGWLTGMIGVGVNHASVAGGDFSDQTDTPIAGWSIDGLVAVPVSPRFAVGVRLGIARRLASFNVEVGGGDQGDVVDFETLPVDAGLTVRYQPSRASSLSRWWFAPWVGVHGSIGSSDESGCSFGQTFGGHDSFHTVDFAMFGLTAAIELADHGGHKLVGYADYRHGLGLSDPARLDDAPMTNIGVLTIGIAYAR